MKFGVLKSTALLTGFAISLIFSNEKDEFFKPTTTLGGYGELHLNYTNPEKGPAKPMKADFHRFVLFFGHSWTPEWSVKSELEIEHNYIPAGNLKGGEVELEQAYIDFKPNSLFGARAGVLLPAVGLYNENHEPPLFTSVERPDYQKIIIPTTWFGNGIGIYGSILNGLDYNLQIIEGLNMKNITSKEGFRKARQKGFESSLENLFLNAKITYTALPGIKTGASLSQNRDIMADSTAYESITLIEAHTRIDYQGIWAGAEIAYTHYGLDGKLNNKLPQKAFGYYAEVGYDLGNFLPGESRYIPWLRFSDLKPAFDTEDDITEKESNYKHLEFGVSVLPIPQVALKADMGFYFYKDSKNNSSTFNLGAGYSF